MKFIEPTFDPAGGAWPLPSNTHQKDISGLENKIAKQSSELNLRLTEILELYNLQSRHANELDTAHEEISRLQRIVSALHGNLKQQKIDAATAQDKITDLENDKAVLRAQLNQTLQDSKSLAGRLHAVQTAFDARETNAASALEQVDYLKIQSWRVPLQKDSSSWQACTAKRDATTCTPRPWKKESKRLSPKLKNKRCK